MADQETLEGISPMTNSLEKKKPEKRLLWGFSLVFLPLIVLMFLQFRWLSQLQTNSEIARRATLDQFAAILSKKIMIGYWEQAKQNLDIDPESILMGCENVFAEAENRDLDGINYLFTASMIKGEKPFGTVYNPISGQHTKRELKADSMYWRVLITSNLEGARSRFVIDDRNPESPIVLQPIFRYGKQKMDYFIGVTGMVMDSEHLKHEVLPREIKALLADTPDPDRLTVVVGDPRGNVVLQNGDADAVKDKAWRNLSFPFTKWEVMLGSTDQSATQWAKTNFIVNLSLSAFLAASLIIGLGLALRAVARELHLSQMKNDFVSNVSHELRTPLSSVRAFGELLRRGKAPNNEKVREYGAYIETESRRLGRLIDNILDFSKIESGQKVYNMESADIREVFIKTVKIFEVRLSRRDLDVNLNVHEPLPSLMRLDADAIAQALSNLLDNAVKYSVDGKQIDVSLREEGNRVLISVQDQGIGIPEEDQQHIFERFHRVSTGLVHDVKGSGLGLSIVRHIIDAHQGDILVQSKLGQGSTFTLSIPIQQSAGSLRAAALKHNTSPTLGN